MKLEVEWIYLGLQAVYLKKQEFVDETGKGAIACLKPSV